MYKGCYQKLSSDEDHLPPPIPSLIENEVYLCKTQ